MRIKGVLGGLLILLLAGCSTYNSLSSAGANVQFVQEKPSSDCRLLGNVVGKQSNWLSGNDESSSMRGAANDLRNKAAAMGGNVIYNVDSPSESIWSSFAPLDSEMVGEVYACPR